MSRIASLFESFGGPETTEHASPLTEAHDLSERTTLLSKFAKRTFWRISVDVTMSDNGGRNTMSTVVEAGNRNEAVAYVKEHFFDIEPQLEQYMRVPANADALSIGKVSEITSITVNKLPTITADLLEKVDSAAAKKAAKVQRILDKVRQQRPETPLQVVYVDTNDDDDINVTSDYIWLAGDLTESGYLIYTEDSKREPLYLFKQ